MKNACLISCFVQVQQTQMDTLVQDIELENQGQAVFKSPDWALISFQGLLGVLTLAVSVFTKVSSFLSFIGSW